MVRNIIKFIELNPTTRSRDMLASSSYDWVLSTVFWDAGTGQACSDLK